MVTILGSKQPKPRFMVMQFVAVNWMFSFRLKFVGLEPILENVGGSGLFLTFWRSMGGSLGEQDVFNKTRVCSKSLGKIVKCDSLSNNAVSNPLERKIIILLVL